MLSQVCYQYFTDSGKLCISCPILSAQRCGLLKTNLKPAFCGLQNMRINGVFFMFLFRSMKVTESVTANDFPLIIPTNSVFIIKDPVKKQGFLGGREYEATREFFVNTPLSMIVMP
jgi:hypothetical protein